MVYVAPTGLPAKPSSTGDHSSRTVWPDAPGFPGGQHNYEYSSLYVTGHIGLDEKIH